MKRTLSFLLVLAFMLSMVTGAFAADDVEGGEQPQESEQQTTITVGTLDELQAAIAAAEDGDTIALSAEIKLNGVTLETEKDITLVRADTYESGSFLRLKNGAVLSGFTVENNEYYATVVCESSPDSAIQIKECTFIGDGENTKSFVEYYSGLSSIIATISNCSFSGAQYSAVMTKNNVQLTITECTFDGNYSHAQGGAIYSAGTLVLNGCTIKNNYAISGGGVYCSGDLTITDCQFSGNSIESEKFGADILSQGTLTITDSQMDGAGYYEESTGEKVTLPLTDYANTAKLIWLTDTDAAVYFAPVEPEEPEEEEPPLDDEQDGEPPTETPTTPSEQPSEGGNEDTPDDQQQPSEPPVNPDNGEDDNTDNEPEIIYRPVYIRVPVYIEREPEEDPAPSLVCGDAVIDTYRSVVLQGYDDGLLHLEDGLTRAQFATILYRLLDEETIERYDSADTVFADVAPDAWYCRTVTTIANAGIVGGTGNGNYDPDAPLTWAHIIIVLSRFVAQQDCQLQNIQYDGWAVDAVETAVALGWITDHAAFDPDAAISRGELAYFVNVVLAMYR